MKKSTYPLLPGFDVPFGRKEPSEEQPPPVAREFAPPRHNNLSLYICHEYEGERIFQRKSDGYFDATTMCRAYGKNFKDWRRLPSTKRHLASLESMVQKSLHTLIETNQGGPYSTRGTWVHPFVAIELGRWLNSDFGVMVNLWWAGWRETTRDLEPFVIGQLVKAVENMDERIERIENGPLARIDRRLAEKELDELRSDKEEQIHTFVIESTPEPPLANSGGRPKYGWNEFNRLVESRSREAGQ